MSEAEVDFFCGLAFTICYTLLVIFGNIYAWAGLYQAIKEEKLMSKKNTCCDPFKGYPPPSNPRWIRFTVWSMLAALLAMLILWSILEG